jgi:5-methylcytosine-specific restriction endonuclease McrA
MDTKSLEQLSNDRLLQATTAIASQRHANTAALVMHLAVVLRRQAYREAGYGSMYRYCQDELHLSEHSAHRFVWAVRLARRFPGVYEAIEDGRVHLAGLRELARHMTAANARELLDAATHRTRADILLMLANRFPRPDVPTVLRPVLASSNAQSPLARADDLATEGKDVAANTSGACQEVAPGQVSSMMEAQINGAGRSVLAAQDPAPPRVTPTSPGRFALQLTLDQRTHDLLRRAQELLGPAANGHDVAHVLAHALEELVRRLEHEKFATTDSPRARRSHADGRYIPAELKRQVAERDRCQCAFVSATGRRCSERSDLQVDHIVPIARGGRTTLENLRLLCPAHNQYEAERVYGEGFMRAKREAAGRRLTCVRERAPGYASARKCAPRFRLRHPLPSRRTKARASWRRGLRVFLTLRGTSCYMKARELASRQACMRCCEVPWPRMALMRSTSLRGLNGLVM